MKKAKLGAKRDPRRLHHLRETAGPNYNKVWGRMPDAIACSGFAKNHVYELIHQGEIESFLYKSREGNERGYRLINLELLNRYIDKRAKEAAHNAIVEPEALQKVKAAKREGQ